MDLKDVFNSSLDEGNGIFSSLFAVLNAITGGSYVRTAIVSLVGIGAAIKGISDAIESAKFEKAEQLSEGFDDAKTSIDEFWNLRFDWIALDVYHQYIRDISDYSGVSHFFTFTKPVTR